MSEFSNYSTSELHKKLKKQKLFAVIQAIVIILMILLSFFATQENGISFLTFLPLFFIPMLVVMLLEVNKIKKALKEKN